MLLDAKSCESSDQTAYKQACTSNVQIELESLCYHSCRFVRSRAVSRIQERARLPSKIARDASPSVLLSILMRKDYTSENFNGILCHIRQAGESKQGRERDDRYDGVLKLIIAIVNSRMVHTSAPYIPAAVSFKTDVRIILTMLSGTDSGAVIVAGGWRAFAKHKSVKVRLAVLAHKDCPEKVLRLFLTDSNWLVYLRAWYKIVLLGWKSKNET